MTDLRALTDTCVHCGFCLPACPTYQLWGEEMDSPRGRIHLIQQVLDGGQMSAVTVGHLDACLGCLACVPACPSGVRYDQIIEEARVVVERTGSRGLADRAVRAGIFAVFPYPRRMRALRGPMRIGQRLGLMGRPDQAGRLGRLANRVATRIHPTLGAMATLAPPIKPRVGLPARVPAQPGGKAGPARAVVGLLTGCVQSALFSHVSATTARVLALEGCDVVIPRGQGCCGALARHTGRDAQARRRARRTLRTFQRAGVDAIVTDVAGCGSAMKEYGELLRDDHRYGDLAEELSGKVRDVTELLVSLGEPLAPRHPLNLTVAYHDACHLSHGQRVRIPPRELLRSIPGVTLVSPVDADTCCGSAGVYNLLQPGAATDLGDRKATALLGTRADVIVAGNPGCLMQIAAALRRAPADTGDRPALMHTVELLDASLRGSPTPLASSL
jgi:glycolate oxidase iron-sulfur subunit